jgi:hypothetical protein
VCGKEKKRASTTACGLLSDVACFGPHRQYLGLFGGSPEHASIISSQGDLSELGEYLNKSAVKDVC